MTTAAELSEQEKALIRLGEIFRSLEGWDMLTLREDGRGQATADAPWARGQIAEALLLLGEIPREGYVQDIYAWQYDKDPANSPFLKEDRLYDADLDDYRRAVGGDESAENRFNWEDKPHRLVYDLVKIAQKDRDALSELQTKVKEAVGLLKECDVHYAEGSKEYWVQSVRELLAILEK